MELISLDLLVKVGFGLIAVATLALLVMHAFENRSPVAPESLSTRKRLFALGPFRLHQFPHVKHAAAVRDIEEPTQRAA